MAFNGGSSHSLDTGDKHGDETEPWYFRIMRGFQPHQADGM